MKNTEEIKKLVTLLKGAHQVYQNCDNNQRIKLFAKCQWIFDRLEALGAAPGFCEALVIYGKEFLDAEYPPEFDPAEEARLKAYAESKGEVYEDWLKRPATVEDAEFIFEAKAVAMTPYEARCSELAKKHNALIYKVLSKEPDAPKIEVLSKYEPNVPR